MTAKSRPAIHRAHAGATLVWCAGLFAYIAAVAHRASFGVASLDALDRFHIDATTVSLFSVVQLGVYAAAQLPVGMALDRFGPRRVILVGAALMTLGQLGMALVPGVGLAIGMRVLIGLGDATTFVGVVRLLPNWFPPRRVPLLTQLTGIVGQFGQVVAAFPFVAFLHSRGWSFSFVALAVLGGVAACAVAVFVHDRPRSAPRPTALGEDEFSFAPSPLSPVPRPPNTATLRAVVRHPGTWLGFWSHLVTGFSLNAFALMWGYPFLVTAQGTTSTQASWLLTWCVLMSIVSGPIIGEFTARHPLRRSWAVLAIAVGVAVGWLLVIVPATPRPMWVLFVFVTLISVGGPGSLIGFDYARTFTDPARLGSATGLVNVGGFVGAMMTVLGIGVVLDLAKRGAGYTLSDFRLAFLVVLAVWAVGVVGVLVCRARTRSTMAESGIIVPPLSEAWARWRGR
ncbi:MFS transporter [Rarobacter faecitabidus]|uniref:Nitrate/nitrite transporter NarK n=1 Tax=Rarobacter faecitabidus TaxID=13243 RepID=A0A542ZA24_RARFA|nr:MFS transporter [Rarobacter faecitabidus]TQL57182.1 nitrate/nitrite transporter NarK [Rarobacter faecitabidus]